jgi:hypothetical protein
MPVSIRQGKKPQGWQSNNSQKLTDNWAGSSLLTETAGALRKDMTLFSGRPPMISPARRLSSICRAGSAKLVGSGAAIDIDEPVRLLLSSELPSQYFFATILKSRIFYPKQENFLILTRRIIMIDLILLIIYIRSRLNNFLSILQIDDRRCINIWVC